MYSNSLFYCAVLIGECAVLKFDVYQSILNRTRDTNERDKRMQVTVKDFCDAIDWF